jgi:hypothetical protein
MAKQTFTTGQVLTAAQMTSLQQTAMGGGAASAKTASYTLVAADAGTAISMNSASATTITVNTALFAAGDTVDIVNLGAGVCTITAGTATVNTASSLALAQYEAGTLDFDTTSSAIFIKGAGAVASGGGMTLLSTTTLTGATTTISSISGSYNSLVAVIFGVTNATADGDFRIAPNGTTNITNQQQTSTSTTLTTNTSDYLKFSTASLSPLRTSTNNAWKLEISNYASATSVKPFSVNGGFDQTSGNVGFLSSGYIKTTSAITSLVFSNSGGNLSTGTVLLYGVK